MTGDAGPLHVALLTGLGAAASWGLVGVAGAIAGPRIGTLRAVVIEQLGSLLGLVLFVAAVPAALGSDPWAALAAAFPLGVLSSLALVAQFAALVLGPVAVVSPLTGAYGGVTVVLAVLLRGEVLGPTQVAGAVLGTVGIFLTAMVISPNSLRGTRIVGPGVLAAMVSALLYGLVALLLTGPIAEFGSSVAIAGNRLGNVTTTTALFVLATSTGWRHARPLLSAAPLAPRLAILLIAAGAGDMAGFLAFGFGLSVGPVWLVGLLSSFGPALGVLYGVVWLHERLRRSQVVGVGMIAASFVLLSLS